MPDNKPPGPPLDFSEAGNRETGIMRVRAGWIGFAVLEELVEHRNGERHWRRATRPVEIRKADAS